MKLTTLERLFHHELKDRYDAEHRIVEAFPKLAESACSPELTAAFEHHVEQTREHISRLESVFEEIGGRPQRESCAGMKGLLEEGQKLLSEDADPVVRDAALISSAQRVEHYEMAAYRTLRTWARILGHEESARVLEETLDEEEGTDSTLTGIAQGINLSATEEKDEEETLEPGESRPTERMNTASGEARTRVAGKPRSGSRQRASKTTARR